MDRLSRQGQYYESSGQVGFTAPFWMLAAVIGAVITGALYGYVSTLVGDVELRIGGCVVFSCIVGVLPLGCAEYGKVRSLPVIIFTSFLCGVLAEYVSLVSWIYALTKQQLLLFDPSDILNMMEYLANDGVWTINGDTPAGFKLYGMWVGEALMLVGIPVALTLKVNRGNGLFCERCNDWINSIDTIFGLESIVSCDELVGKLESGDFDLLESLEQAEPDALSYWTISISQCDTCKQSQFLSIDHIEVFTDEDDVIRKHNRAIVENMLVPFDVIEKIRERWLKDNE